MADRAFYEALATSPEARQRCVEPLRFAASILENNADCRLYYLDCRGRTPESAATAAHAAHATARDLRLLAQRLCDHCRLNSDGTCRYCDAVMAVPG